MQRLENQIEKCVSCPLGIRARLPCLPCVPRNTRRTVHERGVPVSETAHLPPSVSLHALSRLRKENNDMTSSQHPTHSVESCQADRSLISSVLRRRCYIFFSSRSFRVPSLISCRKWEGSEFDPRGWPTLAPPGLTIYGIHTNGR